MRRHASFLRVIVSKILPRSWEKHQLLRSFYTATSFGLFASGNETRKCYQRHFCPINLASNLMMFRDGKYPHRRLFIIAKNTWNLLTRAPDRGRDCHVPNRTLRGPDAVPLVTLFPESIWIVRRSGPLPTLPMHVLVTLSLSSVADYHIFSKWFSRQGRPRQYGSANCCTSKFQIQYSRWVEEDTGAEPRLLLQDY